MRSQTTSSPVEWIAVVTPTPPHPMYWDPALFVRVAEVSGGTGRDPGRADDARAESNSVRASHSVPGNQTGPILVVDDDPTILATVHEILEMEGYPVVAVSDGAEALRRVEEVRPSLLLLDMRMPGITGWEVARQLRERGIAVPILVMTAAQDARLWAEQIDAAGYLPKPFDLDDLLAAIERLWPA